MRAPAPTAQLQAGHRPSELIPPGVHPTHVTIIQAAPRSYLGPVVLTVVATIGATAVVVAILALLQVAAATATAAAAAAPTVGGASITLSLRKGGKR
ncbi:hypothetical protein OG565_33950 (plasmid) [Streptomyces sp. NBC_00138]|uniref:hypothetical protein n=1 Tax=Streptomyces sp. NBC_00138 TaxID=2903625 RepID=UPI002F916433